jgi:metallo-beta-lactamase class B
MFVRLLAAFTLLALAVPAIAKPERFTGKALAAACKGKDGWADPAPPARIYENTYYVGTCGITVLLIATPNGHTLIDGGPPEAAPLVLANIRKLGFRPRDVVRIVGSHEHADHMGGFAALKAKTRAEIALRAPAVSVLASGRADPADPQAGTLPAIPPVQADWFIADKTALRIAANDHMWLYVVATPGHTDGGTSYWWRKGGKWTPTRDLAYVDSLTAVSREGYRFTDHPERVAPFRATFERVAEMPCDILITPHPGASNLFARLAGDAPLVDPAGCKRLAESATAALDRRLASEQAAPTR